MIRKYPAYFKYEIRQHSFKKIFINTKKIFVKTMNLNYN